MNLASFRLEDWHVREDDSAVAAIVHPTTSLNRVTDRELPEFIASHLLLREGMTLVRGFDGTEGMGHLFRTEDFAEDFCELENFVLWEGGRPASCTVIPNPTS